MNGRGAFGPQNVITLDVDLPPEADMADFDGDGDLDVVVASGNDGRLLWFENQNGDGDFDEGRLISDALTAPYSIRAVDFDGDDDQDLLVGDIAGDTLVWYENEDAAGSFGAAQSISDAVLGPSSVFAADLDGDGDVDALAALADADQIVWFRNVSDGGGDRGDFNGDGRVDIEDVDLLCGEIRSGGLDSTFDLTGDNSVNRNDMNELIVNVLDTSFGDANLDSTFNSSDFVVVFQLGEYEDDQVGNSTWAEGDWNCDGDFTTTDLVLAFQAGGFEAAATPRRSAAHG
jgi:hypothetical protein